MGRRLEGRVNTPFRIRETKSGICVIFWEHIEGKFRGALHRKLVVFNMGFYQSKVKRCTCVGVVGTHHT
jgi:hypothetical protein